MPGLLKRSHDLVDATADDDHGLKPSAPPELGQHAPRKRQALEVVEGSRVPTPISSHRAAATTSPNNESAIVPNKQTYPVQGASPEIFHIVDGYQPLSKVVERLAQDTLNNLETLIATNAENEAPSQVNGYSAGSNAASARAAQAIIDKKNRIWEFAQGSRAKFMKLLVLSDWGRRAADISKVIDINHWLMTQKTAWKDAVNWMGELKRILASMKLPPPDLETALGVLATGTADRISDLDYIPKKLLSPQEMLDALQDINAILSIRLNLHEELPTEMHDFSIRSGRATFRVANEFELDLSIADEDLSAQLYFIDFRFSFSPAEECISDRALRSFLEGRCNEILAKEGIQKCYEFLHGFTLTHKWNLLRQEAQELQRSTWKGHIRVETIRRSLIVQYWTQRPGQRSWIELGTRSGQLGTAIASQTPDMTNLFLRVHRQGREIIDHDIRLDAGVLSTETILQKVIEGHVKANLQAARASLRTSEVFPGKPSWSRAESNNYSSDVKSLRVRLSESTDITISQEPVSGSFVLFPPSPSQMQLERQLNGLRDPLADVGTSLAAYRCTVLLETTERQSRALSWSPAHFANPPQALAKKLFGSEQSRLRAFHPPGWASEWILVLATSPSSDRWWAAELDKVTTQGPMLHDQVGARRTIRRTLPVPLRSGQTKAFEPSYKALIEIQQLAGMIVTRFIDIRELSRRQMHYTHRQAQRQEGSFAVPDLYVRYRPGVDSQLDQDKVNGGLLASETVKIAFNGFSNDGRQLQLLVFGRLKASSHTLQALASCKDASLAVEPTSGGFCYPLQLAVGSSSTPLVLERLERICELVYYAQVARKYSMTCTKWTLASLEIGYHADGRIEPLSSPNPAFRGTIKLPETGSRTISFEEGNPHLLISDLLKAVLNRKGKGFAAVARSLKLTLPLLQSFMTLLRRNHSAIDEGGPPANVYVFPRALTYFAICYTSGDFALEYELRLRLRNGKSTWHLTLVRPVSTAQGKTDTSGQAAQDAGKQMATNFRGKPSSNNKATLVKGSSDSKSTAGQSKSGVKAEPPNFGQGNEVGPSNPSGAPVSKSASNSEPSAPTAASVLRPAWYQLCQGKGIGWTGLGTSIMVEPDHISETIRRLDVGIIAAMSKLNKRDSVPSAESGKVPDNGSQMMLSSGSDRQASGQAVSKDKSQDGPAAGLAAPAKGSPAASGTSGPAPVATMGNATTTANRAAVAPMGNVASAGHKASIATMGNTKGTTTASTTAGRTGSKPVVID